MVTFDQSAGIRLPVARESHALSDEHPCQRLSITKDQQVRPRLHGLLLAR
jgi:hypothetical protein